MVNHRVAQQIVGYFLSNASAVDDLEGIARFRLLDEAISREVYEVSEALDWLVSMQLLQRTAGTGRGPLYGLNVQNRAKAQAFVMPGSGPGGPRHKRRGTG
jgi:hypothetical protein